MANDVLSKIANENAKRERWAVSLTSDALATETQEFGP